jgi:hypothetical protein
LSTKRQKEFAGSAEGSDIIEEFSQIAQRAVSKHHPQTFSEGKVFEEHKVASSWHEEIERILVSHHGSVLFRVKPKIRRRSFFDYTPINLVASVDGLIKDITELKANIEEVKERPDKWTTQIRDLGDENYRLNEPLLILIEEYSDDYVIARFPEIEVFGEGNTDLEAIMNLKNSILDLYDELTETDLSILGELPKMWLRVLERVITKE